MNLLDFSYCESFYKWGREHPNLDIISYCLAKRKFYGSNIELGVWTGVSANHIANIINPDTLYAFDSFRGLETEWNGLDENFFKLNEIPRLRNNITLYNGFFSETIPKFIAEIKPYPISFVNVDCDLYQSTVDGLFPLEHFIVPGTILYFDEFYGYPNYEFHEYRALEEFCYNYNRKVRPIAYNDSMGVAFEVLK